MGRVRIEERGSVWILGVQMDRALKWDYHIAAVIRKVQQMLGILGRASKVLTGGSLLSLYHGLVTPNLQYCLIVWTTIGPKKRPYLGHRSNLWVLWLENGAFTMQTYFLLDSGVFGRGPVPAVGLGACLKVLKDYQRLRWPCSRG